MAARQVMPRAALEPRPSDVRMTDERYQSISLFKQLKAKVNLEKFPGTVVVRRFRKGEVICRQGEAGWTAFYILTTEDMYELGFSQLRTAANREEKEEIQAEVTMISNRLSLLRTGGNELKLRTVAMVHLNVARPNVEPRRGFLSRWLGRGPASRALPPSIPIDGPTDIDSGTMTASMKEGELFGEMSCLYRSPRSATVIAARDCYILEMLGNILDHIQKDKAYKEEMDRRYRDRVLQTHVRKLSVFADLSDAHFDILRAGLDLVSFEAGQVICDEFERSDSIYIVRSGVVKVLKKASALLDKKDSLRERHWPELLSGLKEGAAQPATPRGKLWQLLPEKARELVTNAKDPTSLSEADRAEIVYGLNDVLKNRQFAEAKEVQSIVSTPAYKDKISDLPAKTKDWDDREVRRANRFLLDALFPTAIRAYIPRVGPECVLSYCARGDILGEMGLLSRQPRSATCLAYGHPTEEGKDAGQVELVRIPEAIFWKVLDLAPDVRAKVQAQIATRQKRTEQAVKKPIVEEPQDVQFTQRFQELGLLQGQRLMLIDLDRCTRCDECVRACVNTHDDGHSRLFLDGPRFDKYLVPTSCRSCLDPVCMIGCPVGSIHRGDNGQMKIEDWCIGCGRCAKNCPYGSIQMHDLGLVPAVARGWKFTSSRFAPEGKWNQPRFNDGRWLIGAAPFAFDIDFRVRLSQQLKQSREKPSEKGGDDICFRYEFHLGSELLLPNSQFKLEVTSMDPAARVWVNGQLLSTTEKAKRGKREFWLPQKEPAGATNPLHAGRNVLAVQARPDGSLPDIPLLEVRLDAILRPDVPADLAEEITQKQVTERAVVCDLCSDSFGQVPACVNACPHDAAMRVDARFEFPM